MDMTATELADQVIEDIALQREFLIRAAAKRTATAADTTAAFLENSADAMQDIGSAVSAFQTPMDLMTAWASYVTDVSQRAILTADALQQWSDMNVAHQEVGAPPVLIYDYDVILEGKNLPRPSNYMLLKIKPPKGQRTRQTKRPYIIIDPRAGHGPGIGGFKYDSQVGVALADGHPVYFVAFHQEPEPGQTIAAVTDCEARFVAEVQNRHPKSPKPIVVGNCQGGWATAILAATHPELTGPIILNGAPMSYWGGKIGEHPMRYAGGLMGGVTPAMIAADMNGGIFDGSNLVMNFEGQNPGRTWFRKYYDLFRDIDGGTERFLEFERWWGAFYMMTEAEIRWIVENLFVGNRLSKNEAQLEPGVPIDLRAIRAPIICFASHGDNITPPAQALNWILDTYADETEIAVCGQRIIYTVHQEVGHLGIFVSSSVAKKEHNEFVSTLKTIEAFAPGLYEMQIVDHAGEGDDKTFEVSFASRSFDDIVAVTGLRRDEAAFAGAARLSEALAENYDTTMRPAVKAATGMLNTKVVRDMQPGRMTRRAFASGNPMTQTIEAAANLTAGHRAKTDPENPFLMAEHLWADMVEAGWDVLRDMKEMATELSFFAMWASPMAMAYGAPLAHTRQPKVKKDLAQLPAVQDALDQMQDGGVAAGIVRLLLLLAATRSDVRLDRLERSSAALTTRPPFKPMDSKARAQLIYQQRLIVTFAMEEAIQTLPSLLKSEADRKTAKDIVTFVLGAEDEMSDATKSAWDDAQAFLNSNTKTAAQ